jgi:3-methyl-2-oxobutanoate hydroxymethyltransferase
MLGGFKAQGRSAEKARALLADARELESAGCFALVLEAVPAPEITAALRGYVDDVRSGAFPEEQHTYSMPDEELAVFSEAAPQSA